MGANSEYFIPLSEYRAYCDLWGISDYDTIEYMVEVLTRVDSVLLGERMAKLQQDMKRKA